MEHSDIRHKLSEYIDGTSTDDENAEIKEHLKTCNLCSEALEELRKTIAHVKALEEAEPPAWMTQKIMARVREEAESKKGFFARFLPVLAAHFPIRAIAVLFLCVTAFYIYRSMPPATPPSGSPTQDAAALKEIAGRKMRDKQVHDVDALAVKKQVSQAPGYKSLDMKYAYEKPAPPQATAPAIAPSPATPAKAAESAQLVGKSELKRKSVSSYREPAFIDFVRSVETFPYKAPATKRDLLLDGYKKLFPGMRKDAVLATIGQPDYADTSESLDPPYQHKGSYWIYVLTRRTAKFIDPKMDQHIFIFFDLDGKAYWMFPKNIQSVEQKGASSR